MAQIWHTRCSVPKQINCASNGNKFFTFNIVYLMYLQKCNYSRDFIPLTYVCNQHLQKHPSSVKKNSIKTNRYYQNMKGEEDEVD